jgi:predicted lactoylglutathione lyase
MRDPHPMQQRISLITLGVADLPAARAFYEALGWQGAQQPDEEVVFFQAGGMVFALWTVLADRGGGPGVELAHNVGSNEEVDAILVEARDAGGTVVREGAATEWGGYSGAFADPEGYVWEVANNPGWTLNEDGTITLA